MLKCTWLFIQNSKSKNFRIYHCVHHLPPMPRPQIYFVSCDLNHKRFEFSRLNNKFTYTLMSSKVMIWALTETRSWAILKTGELSDCVSVTRERTLVDRLIFRPPKGSFLPFSIDMGKSWINFHSFWWLWHWLMWWKRWWKGQSARMI